MEYGAQILQQLQGLEREAGSSSAKLELLRAEFERSRNESSDRHKMLCDKLETLTAEQRALSESSDARHIDVGKLRELVERCPQHQPFDVPETRLAKKDEDEDKNLRRGLLRGLVALIAAAATALGSWWASGSGVQK